MKARLTSPPLLDRVRPSGIDGPLVSAVLATYGLSLDEPNFFEVDFLPTLLGISSTRDRGATIPVMLERKLAEINCILIADAHALAMSARPSLRIDVHAIGDVTQHAKVVLLHRSNSIRLLVGSANLTHDGFRHSRELVATFDFSPSGPLPGHVLASAIDEWLDALGIRAAESVTQALQAASRAAKDWPGRPLSKGRSLKVAFGGGSVPLWRKLVECWPDGEPVLDWEICSPFWPDVNAQTTPFEEIARALDAKGASLRNTNLSIIARPDAHGDSARPKFPFQIVERLRAKNFPVRKGRLSAARLDLLPEESVDTKGGHDRDLHAKYVVLRGPRTSVALIGSANFTCRGFGTAGRANLEAVVLVCGPAEDLQSSWRPPIAQAGSVEWQTCGIGELAEYKSEDEAIAWPTFLLNVVLEVSWNGCIDPTGRLLIRTLRDASTFFISIEGEAACIQVPRRSSTETPFTVFVSPQAVRALLVKRAVAVRWNDCEATYPINIAQASKVQMPTVLGARPTEQELLAYFHRKLTEEDFILRLHNRATNHDGNALAPPPAAELQCYVVREFVETLRPMSEALSEAMYSARAFENALLGEFSPAKLAEQIAEACRSGRRSATATCFQMIELVGVLTSLRAPNEVSDIERQILGDLSQRAVDTVVALIRALADKPQFPPSPSDVLRQFAKARLSGSARKALLEILNRTSKRTAVAAGGR